MNDILNEIDQFELDQGKQVIVLLARIINQVPYNPVVSQFNDNIMAVAQGRIDSGDKIILVDMENEAGIVYNIQPSGDMWDSLHPYASGYKKMGIEWYSSLIEILPSCPGGGSGDEIIGIGVMGDSNSDEYHANDNRGGEYADTTFTWVEILAQARDLNFGAWGSWDEPRRDGFEYNWARSNATTGSMITSGQHTGIAQQVASGKVSHVFIWIGANDFNIVSGQYQKIYDNSLSDAALQTKVDKIIADMTTAMDTVYQAGDVKIVIATFSDPGISPLTKIDFTDANKRQRVTNAIQDVNEGIKIAAAERGISVVDVDEYGLQVLAKMDEDGYFEFGGEMINVLEQGNEPHHLQLGDSAGHPGTIASGMFANELFIKPINSTYGTQIISLSEIEILEIAGISGSEPTILSNPATESNLWQPYSYDVNASGEPAPIYTLINSPLGMNIDSTSGVITWTPGKTGLLPVTVQAINSAGVDTQSFDINVSGIPQIPCSSPVKVMPLGDSITVGKSSGVDDLSKQISYRKDLWDDLIAAGYSVDFQGSVTKCDFYAGFDPNHEGHGGWTDTQIASNIYDNGGENWLNQKSCGCNPAPHWYEWTKPGSIRCE